MVNLLLIQYMAAMRPWVGMRCHTRHEVGGGARIASKGRCPGETRQTEANGEVTESMATVSDAHKHALHRWKRVNGADSGRGVA